MIIYTAKERRALTLLLLITGALLVLYYLLPSLIKPEVHDYSMLLAELEAIDREKVDAATAHVEEIDASKPFDVNQVSFEELVEFGLSKSVAQIWINYRKAIGGFNELKQLEKIYGLDKAWLAKNKNRLILRAPKNVKAKARNGDEKTSQLVADENLKFDLNTASSDELKKAGFYPESITAIESYREKGGTFYRKEEIKYLPGVSEEHYDKLVSNIKIEKAFLPKPVKTENPIKKATVESVEKPKIDPITIDINNSNEYEWQQLKGIGPYYARSIVKFRKALGGFSTIDQVAETFNLPDSVFYSIKSQLEFSPIPKRIPINSITVDSLRLHPYFTWKHSSIIVNYRNNHGPFQQIDDFYKLRVFDTAFVRKVEPYLGF